METKKDRERKEDLASCFLSFPAATFLLLYNLLLKSWTERIRGTDYLTPQEI